MSGRLPEVFRLLTGRDVLNLPRPEWLLDGLIPQGLAVLVGPPSSGKSFVALSWALCCAAGRPWLGYATRPGYVVYVAAEGTAGLGARYREWLRANNVADVECIRFLPEAVNLRDGVALLKLRATLASLPEPPVLVVIDTMARVIPGGDENSARDVGEFVAALDGLGVFSVLVVHHTKKDSAAERGSSALRGAADVMALLRRETTRGALRLECEKPPKDGEAWNDLRLRLEAGEDSCTVSLVHGAPVPEPIDGEVFRTLRESTGPLSLNALTQIVRRRRADISQALNRLRESGSIVNDGNGWEVVPREAEPPGNRVPAPCSAGVPAGPLFRGAGNPQGTAVPEEASLP